jgi:hypothetical protein
MDAIGFFRWDFFRVWNSNVNSKNSLESRRSERERDAEEVKTPHLDFQSRIFLGFGALTGSMKNADQ